MKFIFANKAVCCNLLQFGGTSSALFQLPLTCFEEYMLCDDRPAYPMTGIFRLRFSGFLHREALEAGITAVFQRHPLLRATIDRKRGRRPRWLDHPDWRPKIQWHAEANIHGFPQAEYIDLTEEPGSRVWVLDRNDGHDLIIQVHHCCTDAPGMNRVFEDLLVRYAMALGTAGGGISLSTLEPQRLFDRGTPGLTTWKFLGMLRKQAVGLMGVRQFLMRSPVPLTDWVNEIDKTSSPPVFPAPLIHTFDTTETKGIIITAKALGVTVNDLLARDLFLAVGDWRKAEAGDGEQDWLRFSIPMNLRIAEDITMPMANSVSTVFLDRQTGDLSDPEALLQGIQEEMGLIKRLKLHYTFILSLAVTRLLPGGLSRKTMAEKCQTTSCLSNLGPVLTRTPLPRLDGRIVAGNVVLESVDYVIPLRPHLNAGFCIYTYANRLRILMHFDPRALTDKRAEELLENYIGQIHRSMANHSG